MRLFRSTFWKSAGLPVAQAQALSTEHLPGWEKHGVAVGQVRRERQQRGGTADAVLVAVEPGVGDQGVAEFLIVTQWQKKFE